MQEAMDMRGRLMIRLTGRDGRLIDEHQHPNLIVKSGRELVAQLFAGVSGGTPPTRVTHMAVGDDAAPPTDLQQALLKERSPRKKIAEVTYSEFDETTPRGSVRRVKATLKAVFDFGEANNPAVPLQEAGVFNAAAGGVMYNRVVFKPVTKTEAFQLTLLWDITF
jgi:hypothetical protein